MGKNQSGSSLVEVMIMMVIMSISIVGIYSMVNAGQRLAQTTDTKRIALAIAREGIESTTNIRDTFALRKYSVDVNAGCFFSIDATNYGDCPDTNTKYILGS
jgi:Tfp pilus assembly protein PilV